ELRKERSHRVLAVTDPVPRSGGPGGLGRPVHVVRHGVEDGGDVAAAEGLVHAHDGLDVGVSTDVENPSQATHVFVSPGTSPPALLDHFPRTPGDTGWMP